MDKQLEWKPLWHYRMIDFGTDLMDLKGIIQRLKVRVPVCGEQLRIRLDNSYNSGIMKIDRIEARCYDHGNDKWTLFTVNGNTQVELVPGELIFTDPAEIKVEAGKVLEIQIVFAEINGLRGMCQTWARASWQSAFREKERDWISSIEMVPYLSEDVHEPDAAIGISQIDIMADSSVRTIAMFGDSITHMSYYSDALHDRIMREYPGRAVIANAGAGGNRLCQDASYSPELGEHSAVFGPAGYKRFESDIFTDMQPDAVLILEGINDLTHGFQYGRPDQVPETEEYVSLMAGVIETAHNKDAEIYIGTIMPENVFAGETWFHESETRRKEINGWIRTQSLTEGVMDFDKKLSEGEELNVLKDGHHLDGLHPNEKGGAVMAGCVPLDLIMKA